MHVEQPVPDSPARSLLDRLGTALVGMAVTSVVTTRLTQKSGEPTVMAATPAGCYGYPGCDFGCGGSPVGSCCWYYIDDRLCRAYRCCDRFDLSPRPCICRHFVGNFC